MIARAGGDPTMRRVRLALALPVLLAVLGLTFAVGAPTASAHAVVTGSKPADGEQLRTAPSDVIIDFSETISSELGGLKVLDAGGNRVDQNDSAQPTPTSLRTTLAPGLTDGTYVANYKVVSADGHAISGAIVFAVGNARIGDVSGLEAKNDLSMETLSRVGQFLTYLGALLAAGLAFFLAFVHDRAADGARLRSATRWSTIGAAVGIAVTIVAQAALATGGGPGAVLQAGTIGPVLRQGLGWSAAVLLVGLAAVHLSVDMKKLAVAQALAFYGGLAVTGSFVLWGHPTESDIRWVSIPADVVHVAAAAAWFGGLVGLVFVLRARRPLVATAGGTAGIAPTARAATLDGDDAVGPSAGLVAADERGSGGVALLTRSEDGIEVPTDEGGGPPPPGSFASTAHIVGRFSNLAAVCVILLAAAGSALAYIELGSFSALFTTSYGITLTIKLGLVAVVLFMAGYNRYVLLPWLLEVDPDRAGSAAPIGEATADAAAAAAADRSADGWRRLLRTLGAEALGIVAILGVTAVLVNVTPGLSTEVKGPYQASAPFRGGQVSMTIAPNAPGPNNIHLDFTGPDGKPSDAAQKVTLELSLPAKDLGPFTREFVKGGTGHFILEDIKDISIPGDWRATLLVRVSDFDQERVELQDTVP